jgi:hypothetical protein
MPWGSRGEFQRIARGLAATVKPTRAAVNLATARDFAELIMGEAPFRNRASWKLAYGAALGPGGDPRARAMAALDAAEQWALVGERKDALAMIDRAEAALKDDIPPVEHDPLMPGDQAEALRFMASRIRAAIHMRFGEMDQAEAALNARFEVDDYNEGRGENLAALLHYMKTGSTAQLTSPEAEAGRRGAQRHADLATELEALVSGETPSPGLGYDHVFIPLLLAGAHRVTTNREVLTRRVRAISLCEMSGCTHAAIATRAFNLRRIAEGLGDATFAAEMEAVRRAHVDVLRRPELALLLDLFEHDVR